MLAVTVIQLLHPLSGNGYQFWSGIGSDVGEVTVIGAVGAVWMHHNCHVKGCWRIGRNDPYNHHPACRHHHSHRDKIGDDPNHG